MVTTMSTDTMAFISSAMGRSENKAKPANTKQKPMSIPITILRRNLNTLFIILYQLFLLKTLVAAARRVPPFSTKILKKCFHRVIATHIGIKNKAPRLFSSSGKVSRGALLSTAITQIASVLPNYCNLARASLMRATALRMLSSLVA